MIKLTKEEAEAKAKALSIELGKPVEAICLEISEGDLCVGFVREASRQAKIVAIGNVTIAGSVNPVDIGMPYLESGFIKEHSDPRMNPVGGDDDIVISAAIACSKKMRLYSNALKKK